MVFDPTFHEIDEEAAELPDLDGSDPDAGPLEIEDEANALPPLGEE